MGPLLAVRPPGRRQPSSAWRLLAPTARRSLSVGQERKWNTFSHQTLRPLSSTPTGKSWYSCRIDSLFSHVKVSSSATTFWERNAFFNKVVTFWERKFVMTIGQRIFVVKMSPLCQICKSASHKMPFPKLGSRAPIKRNSNVFYLQFLIFSRACFRHENSFKSEKQDHFHSISSKSCKSKSGLIFPIWSCFHAESRL